MAMNRAIGGMQFTPGRPIRLPSPPDTLQAQPIQVVCPNQPVIAVGQTVSRGQLIANREPSDTAACTSPVAGVVREVIPVGGGGESGGSQSEAQQWVVRIEPDQENVPTAMDLDPPRERRIDHWLDVMRGMGRWAVRDGGVGLEPQLRAAHEHKPDTLICVGLDSYPPFPVRSSLVVSFPDDMVFGTMILADLVEAQRVIILASRSSTVVPRIRQSCRNFQVRLVTWDNVYPCADPTLVVSAHTPGGRRLRVGANPVRDVGVMLINPWTAIRIARWFTLRRFDIVRPMMIGWPGPDDPMTACYAIPGQPLSSLDARLGDAMNAGDRIVLGNPMADRTLTAQTGQGGQQIEPVVSDHEMLITIMRRVTPVVPEPCISCGWCVDTCPTGLRPNRLYELCQEDPENRYLHQQLQWCIDCGLCSHTCPSSLPLAQTFRQTVAP